MFLDEGGFCACPSCYFQLPLYYVLYINLKAATLQIPAGIWNIPFCWCWQPNQQAFVVN